MVFCCFDCEQCGFEFVVLGIGFVMQEQGLFEVVVCCFVVVGVVGVFVVMLVGEGGD